MKTYCKDVDITNRNLIARCVRQCLSGKYTRRDVLALLSTHSGRSRHSLLREIREKGNAHAAPAVERVIDALRSELLHESLNLVPIWYSEKMDASSRKVRRIGIQDIKQQMYDYIAVEGLKPILRRIGEYQCASIPGRGQSYGIRAVRKWVRNPAMRYAAKLDIQKCYESIDREKLMDFLRRYVRNEKLLWLVEKLIYTFEKGLSIGSYLSQYLCNLYLSELYHYASEKMYRTRRHKAGGASRINLVKHVLFYVDDILLLGTNAKDMHRAVEMLCEKARKMGLTAKTSWSVFSLTGRTFIDMMGARIYRGHATIRRRVFLRVRRAYKRALRRIKERRGIPITLARRCASYYGALINTNSFKLRKRLRVPLVIKICKEVISHESKVLAAAARLRRAAA